MTRIPRSVLCLPFVLIALWAIWAPTRRAEACPYPPPPDGYWWDVGDQPSVWITRGGNYVSGQTLYLPYNASNQSWTDYGFSLYKVDRDNLYYYYDLVDSVFDNSWESAYFYPSLQNQAQYTVLYGC